MVKILIVGGYGTFGGRLAELLSGNSNVNLLIGGRSLERARSFCACLAPGAPRSPVIFDRDGDVSEQLQTIEPDLVVDAAGPFQCYGDDPYRLIVACLAMNINYLDLADGAEFVTRVGQFDREARARGVFVLSGVSSFPVLSAAVVRHLAQTVVKLDRITGGVAPSPYAGVGVNVIRAIASYAGNRVPLVRDGRRSFGVPLTESMRYTVCPPGRLPLRNIRYSLVDVPDLQMLPASWPGLTSIWMGAGPVPEILHLMLNGLAWLVRLHLLPSLSPFAALMHRVTNWVRWGEHRGGMFIAITGTDNRGEVVDRSWHLLAEGDDGPFIPSMACQSIIERIAVGRLPAPGARDATAELELTDYEALFSRRTIYTGTWLADSATRAQPLYQRILGDAWAALPQQLRTMHDCSTRLFATGRATVERGRSPLARLVAFAVGFPVAGRDVPVRVEFKPEADGERWTRTFAGRSFSSFQFAGRGGSAHLLEERFGPLIFSLALVVDGPRLRLVVRRWSVWGVPLPAFLAPRGEFHESVVDGRFHFHVEIRQRLIGLIVGYSGWLAPCA